MTRNPVMNALTRPCHQAPDSEGDGYGQPAILPRQPAWPRSTQTPRGAEMTGLVLENLAEYSEHPGKITELYEARAM